MNEVKRKPKDEKAQVYYTKITQDGTKEVKHRHFIYSEAKKNSGGLYVSARDIEKKEKVSISIALNINAKQFTFNMNPKITQNCKVIYRGKVYDLESTDEYDMRSVDMTAVGKETTDTQKYGEDQFDE